MTKESKLLLVGFGAMGSALYESFKDISWLDITVVSPHLDIAGLSEKNPNTSFVVPDDLGEEKFDFVLLAVKPQVMGKALEFYAKNIDREKSVIISIAAGVTTEKIESVVTGEGGADSLSVVRVMPNTPAQIGEGVAALFFNKHVKAEDKTKVKDILKGSSKVLVELSKEDDFHGVTAFTGSGPAYVFYFMESMLQCVDDIDISEEEKILMCEQLFAGSALYAKNMFGQKSIETLRREVTSPNGTTEAGLSVLMDGRFDEVMKETIMAAKERSIELSKI